MLSYADCAGTIAANRLAKLDEIGFNWGGIEKTSQSSSCGDVGEKKLPVRSKSIDKQHQEMQSGNRADRSVRRSGPVSCHRRVYA